MKVIDDRHSKSCNTIQSIQKGESFEYLGDVYTRIDLGTTATPYFQYDNRYAVYAICQTTGEMRIIGSNNEVIPLITELHIKQEPSD